MRKILSFVHKRPPFFSHCSFDFDDASRVYLCVSLETSEMSSQCHSVMMMYEGEEEEETRERERHDKSSTTNGVE